MEQPESNAERHLRLCAARNWRTALGFVLFSGLLTFVSWHSIGRPLLRETSPWLQSSFEVYVLLFFLWCVRIFRCSRERAILCVYVATGILAIAQIWFIEKLAPITYVVERLTFVAYSFALLMSMALLLSALTNSSGHGTNKKRPTLQPPIPGP
jgi:hypothetical protein